MRKVLLGTTALAAVGLLVSGVAQAEEEAAQAEDEMAQAEVGPVSVSVGGYYNAAVGFVGGDAGEDKHSRAFAQDMEVIVSGSTTLDNGITVGVAAHIEGSNTNGPKQATNTIDDKYIYFSGPFGDIKTGNIPSAAITMSHFAPHGAGIFGVNTPFFTFGNQGSFDPAGGFITTGDDLIGHKHAAKLVYFTPVVNGFRLGASYAPSDTEQGRYGGNVAGKGNSYKNQWSVGAEYTADFGEASLKTIVGYEGYQYDGMCDNSVAYINEPGVAHYGGYEKWKALLKKFDKNGNGSFDGLSEERQKYFRDLLDERPHDTQEIDSMKMAEFDKTEHGMATKAAMKAWGGHRRRIPFSTRSLGGFSLARRG